MQEDFTRIFKVYVVLKTDVFALTLTFTYTNNSKKFILSETSRRLFWIRIIS